jgi:hypothetical protein
MKTSLPKFIAFHAVLKFKTFFWKQTHTLPHTGRLQNCFTPSHLPHTQPLHNKG